MPRKSPTIDLGRRQLLAGGAATALMLASGARAHAQTTPKSGGRLRLGLSHANTNDAYDPASWGTSAIVNIGLWGAVYNNLVEIGPDGQVVPELAETIEPSEDAKTWTFKLRKCLPFPDATT